jgi:hypothetical protein
MDKKELNLFEITQAQLDKAASILELEAGIHLM